MALWCRVTVTTTCPGRESPGSALPVLWPLGRGLQLPGRKSLCRRHQGPLDPLKGAVSGSSTERVLEGQGGPTWAQPLLGPSLGMFSPTSSGFVRDP